MNSLKFDGSAKFYSIHPVRMVHGVSNCLLKLFLERSGDRPEWHYWLGQRPWASASVAAAGGGIGIVYGGWRLGNVVSEGFMD